MIPFASTERGEPGRVLKNKNSSVDAICAGSRNNLGLSFDGRRKNFYQPVSTPAVFDSNTRTSRVQPKVCIN
jgi:hypothetical protein